MSETATTTRNQIQITDTIYETDASDALLGGRYGILVTGSYSLPEAVRHYIVATQVVEAADDTWHFEVLPDQVLPFGRFVRGGIVKVPFENEAVYRLINEEAGTVGPIVQYFDEAHADYRNKADCPWDIIHGADGPWPFPKDGLASVHTWTWVRIEPPAALMEASFAAARMESHPNPQPELDYIDNEASGHTFGMAKVDDDGWVVANPAVVPGMVYLAWEEHSATTMVGTAVATDAGFVLMCSTELSYSAGRDRIVHTAVTYRRVLADGLFWAMAASTKPEAVPKPDALAELQRRKTVLDDAWSSFNEDLNDMAENKGWCSEYDEIVEAQGMFRRSNDTYDYDVHVRATVRITIESPDSIVDDRLESCYSLSVSTTSLTYTGTADIRVRVTEQESESDARESVDADDVREEIDSNISGEDSWELIDWDVTGASEAD